MKDYLTSNERLKIMLSLSYLEYIEEMADTWPKRDVINKEEGKNLKMARTYLNKFLEGFLNKIEKKEVKKIYHKMSKNSFRLYDNYELNNIEKRLNNAMDKVVIDREEFEDFCCEIMDTKCKDCKKSWLECNLHKLFEKNLVPEASGYENTNCRYAYYKR